MKIIVIGDALVSSKTLSAAVKEMKLTNETMDIKSYEWYSDLSKDAFQEHILAIERNGPEKVAIPDGILTDLESAEYLFCHYAPVSKAMIEAGKNLKLIGTCRGGLENVNVAVLRQNQIPFLHVIRNAEPVADFTIGLMYAETRNIARSHCEIKNGKWEKSFSNDAYKTVLSNLTVGIAGAGYIGKQVISRLNGLNVEVLVFDPFVDRQRLKKEGFKVKFVETLAELFESVDIISLHMRVTPETRHLINADYIERMKPSSYLINTARADLINKVDLIDALTKKTIAGAALDVSWVEPIPLDDPLLKLDNVTLTPHIAGDTVDAIPQSPFLLKKVVNDYLKNGYSDMLIQ